MNSKKYLIIYLVILITLIALAVIFESINDMVTMILFAVIIVVTSIYTYGNRRKK